MTFGTNLLAPLMRDGGGMGWGNGLHRAAEQVAKMGRWGDTVLAHISPEEAAELYEEGGAGTINPHTGLPEFYKDKDYGGNDYGGGGYDKDKGAGDYGGGGNDDLGGKGGGSFGGGATDSGATKPDTSFGSKPQPDKGGAADSGFAGGVDKGGAAGSSGGFAGAVDGGDTAGDVSTPSVPDITGGGKEAPDNGMSPTEPSGPERASMAAAGADPYKAGYQMASTEALNTRAAAGRGANVTNPIATTGATGAAAAGSGFGAVAEALAAASRTKQMNTPDQYAADVAAHTGAPASVVGYDPASGATVVRSGAPAVGFASTQGVPDITGGGKGAAAPSGAAPAGFDSRYVGQYGEVNGATNWDRLSTAFGDPTMANIAAYLDGAPQGFDRYGNPVNTELPGAMEALNFGLGFMPGAALGAGVLAIGAEGAKNTIERQNEIARAMEAGTPGYSISNVNVGPRNYAFATAPGGEIATLGRSSIQRAADLDSYGTRMLPTDRASLIQQILDRPDENFSFGIDGTNNQYRLQDTAYARNDYGDQPVYRPQPVSTPSPDAGGGADPGTGDPPDEEEPDGVVGGVIGGARQGGPLGVRYFRPLKDRSSGDVYNTYVPDPWQYALPYGTMLPGWGQGLIVDREA